MAVQSAADLPAVADTVTRLKSLLDLAGSRKPVATIEPPLLATDILDEVESLRDSLSTHEDQAYRFILIETAVREIFYSLIRSIEIEDPAFVQVWNLLDITLICGDHAVCTPELVCWLLEELLDSQTTHGCRKVFDYLELRRERLAQKDFHKKNLVFLRTCNELLRRLSRAEDAIFCGRVFFFLFQTFPLGDKSSVNLRGEFHVDNVTSFDAQGESSLAVESDNMELDETAEITKVTKESTPVPSLTASQPETKGASTKTVSKKIPDETVLPDHELYPIFWTLQHDFSNPTRLYDPKNFADFKQGLRSTISKFKRSPTVVQTKLGEDHRPNLKPKSSDDEADMTPVSQVVDNYNPKYLTSRDLFHLELSDLAFQRHILVQALILIDFLLSLTDAAKKKRDALALPNRALLYAYTLSEEDAKWAAATRATITDNLQSTREGREYCRMVETVLARDKNWVRWKMESCPSIVKGPVPTGQELAARKGVEDFSRPRRMPDRSMGMNLSFLDEGTTGGLEALKASARYTSLPVQALAESIQMNQLDAEMATEDEKIHLDSAIANKKWRMLRKARATNLRLLDKIESTKDLMDVEALLRTQDDPIEPDDLGQVGDEAVQPTAFSSTTSVDNQASPMPAENKVPNGE